MNDPIYYLEIEEGDGLTQVSLVSAPAIEENFHAFAEQEYYDPDQPRGEDGQWGDGSGGKNGIDDEDIQKINTVVQRDADKLGLKESDYSVKYGNTPNGLAAYVKLTEQPDGKYVLGKEITINKKGKDISFVEKTVSHELRHIWQAQNKGFYATREGMYWEDKLHISTKEYNKILNGMTKAKTKEQFNKYKKQYLELPWEKDADDFANIKHSFSIIDKLELQELPTDLIELPFDEIEQSTTGNSFSFAIQSEEKRIITGPAMLAERPIYRRGPDGSEYYVKFSAATIEKAVRLWATQGKYNAVNAEHSSPVGGLFLMESFITDPTRGINPPEAWKDAPAGSWFLSYYVQDDALWAKVKSGEFRGFSIEGYFTDKPADPAEETLAAMRAILSKCDTLNINTLSEMNALNKIQEIKKLLGFSDEAPVQKFGEGTLADGTLIRWAGETLEIGAVLEVQTPEGEYVPAPDGTHETADGQLVSTEGGIVTEIMLKEDDSPEEAPVEDSALSAMKAEYAAKFAEQATAIEKLTAAIENLTNAQAKTVEVLEQFSAIPAEEPVKKPNAFSGTAAKRDEQIMRVAENLKKLKTIK